MIDCNIKYETLELDFIYNRRCLDTSDIYFIFINFTGRNMHHRGRVRSKSTLDRY